MSNIITIDNLNYFYNHGEPTEVQALSNINIEIEKGGYVAFFGPSGCGKTTLLYSLSGIDRFHSGTVVIDGQNIAGLSNHELAIFRQTGIGIIFQQFNLIPSLNVLKNVALPMLFVGATSEKAEIEAAKLLERLDMAPYGHRYPSELSGGQQQRVGIARALANDPPIIIADEPLGNLDSENAAGVLEFIKELNEKDGRTIIMVTHEAWSLRDVSTIFHMKDGGVAKVENMKVGNVATSLAKNLYDKLSIDNPTEEKNTEENPSNRILANFFLRRHSMDEIQVFESVINGRFANNISKGELFKLFHKSFKEGGVGLRKKQSYRITEYIEEIIDRRKDVAHIYDLIKKNPAHSIDNEIQDIRRWIQTGYTGKLTLSQLMALNQVISDRIKGFVPENKVAEILNLPINEFGAGLSFRASQLMAEKLALILNGKDEKSNNGKGLNESVTFEEKV